ncbi:MAG: Lrp/AsnC family transcriptional regulator, partial [Dehalococcoidia bacterium]
AARHINRHPGVSHNYARNGYFNLWFTLAVAPGENLEETVERMVLKTAAEAFRIMPTTRLFKLNVNFDMVAEKGASHGNPGAYGHEDPHVNENQVEPVTDFEIRLIRELQENLPICSRPFTDMASRLGITEDDLFSHASDFQARGIMRRYAAILNHRRAGFRANGMAVWRVPPERSEEVGNIMADHPAVTHCYQRPSFPEWPYTHFSMVHSTTKAGCEEIAREISERTGITEYQVLYSYKEYKKTRVRYFV